MRLLTPNQVPHLGAGASKRMKMAPVELCVCLAFAPTNYFCSCLLGVPQSHLYVSEYTPCHLINVVLVENTFEGWTSDVVSRAATRVSSASPFIARSIHTRRKDRIGASAFYRNREVVLCSWPALHTKYLLTRSTLLKFFCERKNIGIVCGF